MMDELTELLIDARYYNDAHAPRVEALWDEAWRTSDPADMAAAEDASDSLSQARGEFLLRVLAAAEKAGLIPAEES